MPTTLAAPTARLQRRTDLDLLQGAWTTIAGRRAARLLVAGRRFAFELPEGGDVYIGTFEMTADAEPRRLDMLIEEGPESYKGQRAFCIYHLDGDILRWCPAKPGAEVRLS